MTHLLDTSVCIRHLRSRGRSGLTDRLRTMTTTDVVVCSVVRAELLTGALRSREAVRNLAEVERFLSLFLSLPFDDAAADAYARIRADLEARGTPIGSNDLMIAATASARNLTVVTQNTAEFTRVPGLRVEDWDATSP